MEFTQAEIEKHLEKKAKKESEEHRASALDREIAQRKATLSHKRGLAQRDLDFASTTLMDLRNEATQAQLIIEKYTAALSNLQARLPLAESAFNEACERLAEINGQLRAIGE